MSASAFTSINGLQEPIDYVYSRGAGATSSVGNQPLLKSKERYSRSLNVNAAFFVPVKYSSVSKIDTELMISTNKSHLVYGCCTGLKQRKLWIAVTSLDQGDLNDGRGWPVQLPTNFDNHRNWRVYKNLSKEVTVMSKMICVEFLDALIPVVEHNNEPYVPAKVLAEGMELDWAGQYSKLNHNRQRWSIEKISIVDSKNKNRPTICIPVRKLPGWLCGIQVNKLPNEKRAKVIAFQNECDDVLWQHWNSDAPSKSSKNIVSSSEVAIPDQSNNKTFIVATLSGGNVEQVKSFSGELIVLPKADYLALLSRFDGLQKQANKDMMGLLNEFLAFGLEGVR